MFRSLAESKVSGWNSSLWIVLRVLRGDSASFFDFCVATPLCDVEFSITFQVWARGTPQRMHAVSVSFSLSESAAEHGTQKSAAAPRLAGGSWLHSGQDGGQMRSAVAARPAEARRLRAVNSTFRTIEISLPKIFLIFRRTSLGQMRLSNRCLQSALGPRFAVVSLALTISLV
jgi:hypothetical protein